MPGHLISPAVQRKGRKRTPSGAVRGHNAHIHFIYGEILDPIVAAEIVVMDGHFGGVGKIQQLPGEPQLNIVAVRYKIRERIKLGALRVGIAVFQSAGFKGCLSKIQIPFRLRFLGDIIYFQGHFDSYKIGRVGIGDVVGQVGIKTVNFLRIGGTQ